MRRQGRSASRREPRPDESRRGGNPGDGARNPLVFDLLANRRRDEGQLVPVDAGREGMAEPAVDPVEDIERGFLREAQRGVLVGGIPGRGVKRQPLAGGVLVHEPGDGADVAGQQAATDQITAEHCQPGRARRRAEALGKPGDELATLPRKTRPGRFGIAEQL